MVVAAKGETVEASRLAGGQTGGVLQTVVAAAALGTLGPVSTIAYTTGIAAATFSALRALIGALLLAALVLTGRHASVSLRSLPRRQQAMLAMAVLANATQNLALFAAFDAMAVPIVMALFYTYPAVVAIVEAALGRERLTSLRIGALACAAIGLALVLGPRLGPGATASTPGILLAATAALCHATYFIVARRGFPDVPAVQATSLVLAGGVIVSGSAALLALGTGVAGPWMLSPIAWASALFAGTFGAAFSKVLVLRGVRTIGATRAALLMLLEPVVAIVLAALILGQSLGPTEVVGAVSILVAAVLVQRPDRIASVGGAPATGMAG